MIDGDTKMTESSGICHYLGTRHGPTPLMVGVDEPAYGAFLNWMYFSDATLTFPQTLVLRYTQLEPEERRNPQVATDYAKWFLGRLRAVEAATAKAETLAAGRFTAADIVIGYALAAGREHRPRQGFRAQRRRLLAAPEGARRLSAGGGRGNPGRGRTERGAPRPGVI